MEKELTWEGGGDEDVSFAFFGKTEQPESYDISSQLIACFEVWESLHRTISRVMNMHQKAICLSDARMIRHSRRFRSVFAMFGGLDGYAWYS